MMARVSQKIFYSKLKLSKIIITRDKMQLSKETVFFLKNWTCLNKAIGRSSRSDVFSRKSVLKICSKFTGENPCRSVILFIEITFRHGCSPVNLLHIFRTSFPSNTSGWLLLNRYQWGRNFSARILQVQNKSFLS